jgi:Tat protein secretion system quality control protein TatD with DNase activity
VSAAAAVAAAVAASVAVIVTAAAVVESAVAAADAPATQEDCQQPNSRLVTSQVSGCVRMTVGVHPACAHHARGQSCYACALIQSQSFQACAQTEVYTISLV